MKEAFVAAVTSALVAGRDVSCDLGAFRLYEIPAYEGRNPRTGETVPVPARRWPVFSPSRELIRVSFGGGNVPVPPERYAHRDLAPDEARLYMFDDAFGRPIGCGVANVEVDDPLVRDIGDALRRGKKYGISRLGKFATERLPRRRLGPEDERHAIDLDLEGKWIVTLKVSIVLRAALAAP
ncbi:MAG TPA: HU family DNA-binding protein [Polyangiaceae bacterium]